MIRSPAPSERFRPLRALGVFDQLRDRLALKELRHSGGLYVRPLRGQPFTKRPAAVSLYAVSLDETTRPPRPIERDADQAGSGQHHLGFALLRRHAIETARSRKRLDDVQRAATVERQTLRPAERGVSRRHRAVGRDAVQRVVRTTAWARVTYNARSGPIAR